MDYIKSNTNFYLVLLTICISPTLSSCKLKDRSDEESFYTIGKITIKETADNCGKSKCIHFITSSPLVANGKSGIIRIDEPTDTVRSNVVMYAGALGNFYVDDFPEGTRFLAELLNAGCRVIQVRWDSGWFIGSPGKYEGFKKLAVHPATATDYIYRKLVDKEKPFILFGGSGGAAQIAYMLTSYGTDAICDAAIVWAGFWMGRLDIGCLDKDSIHAYMHIPDFGKPYIDLAFGFDSSQKGPCRACDSNYINLLKESSISYRGNFYYPHTRLYLLYGGNDSIGALNQGLTYYHKVAAAKSPFVHMQVVDGAPHSMLMDSTGYKVLKDILLSEAGRSK